MSDWDDVAIAILAGGASTRMGRDKAALEMKGEPLLQRTARLALEFSVPVGIVGRAAPHGWPRDLEAAWIADAPGTHGPLGGLAGALGWAFAFSEPAQRTRLLLLPCDLPLLELSALEWIAEQASTCAARDGLATVRGEQLEPLFSVYFAGIEGHARKYLESGRRSLHGLIESGDFARAQCPGEVAAQLFNCNTPDDWRRAQAGEGREDSSRRAREV
jgi:molybdopterin-guanine dinucleotide biosynthesis protein A